MKDVLIWLKIVLILGGVAFAMIGMMWAKTAELMAHFGVRMREDLGLKVMFAGMAMFGVGMGWLYLQGNK